MRIHREQKSKVGQFKMEGRNYQFSQEQSYILKELELV